MLGRRGLLSAAALLAAPPVHGQPNPWDGWLGTYAGAACFHRSIPLEDIFPPPKAPPQSHDDGAPFALHFAVRPAGGSLAVWLRIDGGPVQTDERGETLVFGPVSDGVAILSSADARVLPRTASLTVRANQLSTEALFAHADGSFWRRHFTATFTAAGADVILWVFDATGTRARTWRGASVRRS